MTTYFYTIALVRKIIDENDVIDMKNNNVTDIYLAGEHADENNIKIFKMLCDNCTKFFDPGLLIRKSESDDDIIKFAKTRVESGLEFKYINY